MSGKSIIVSARTLLDVKSLNKYSLYFFKHRNQRKQPASRAGLLFDPEHGGTKVIETLKIVHFIVTVMQTSNSLCPYLMTMYLQRSFRHTFYIQILCPYQITSKLHETDISAHAQVARTFQSNESNESRASH
jgi:hypothetical protein